MKFCKRCGNKLVEGQKFCVKCGAKLEILSEINKNDINIEVDKENINNEINSEVNKRELNIEVKETIDKEDTNIEVRETVDKKDTNIEIKETIKLDSEKEKVLRNIDKDIINTKVEPQKKFEKRATKQKEKKKIDKKLLIALVSISILLVVAIVAKIGLVSYFSAEKTVVRFEKYILENETEKIKSMLYFGSEEEVSDFEVEAFIELLKSDRELFNDIKIILRTDVLNAERLMFEGSPELLENEELIGLTMESKNPIFIKYGIIVNRTPLVIDSNVQEVTALIGDNEIGTMGEDGIGSFIPGIYNITLKSQDFFENEIEDTQIIRHDYNYYDENPDFFEDYKMYSVYCNIPTAALFVNDVDTNMLAGGAEENFGPLKDGDTLIARYSLNGKEYESEIATSGGSQYLLNVDFSYNDYSEIEEYLEEQIALEELESNSKIYIEKYEDKDFIIENSSTGGVGFKDLNEYSAEELFIAQYEILARHGMVFEDKPVLQKYFESKEWYEKDFSYDGELSNEVEIGNYNTIRNTNFLVLAKEDSPEIMYDYVFEDSSDNNINRFEVRDLNDWELVIARNEIFARHGLKFNTNDLVEYFESKDWYQGIEGVEVALNETEVWNVEYLVEEEVRRTNEVLNKDLGE